MSLRRFLFKMKPFSPVILGLVIGILLSLLTAPLMEESCDTSMVYDHLGRGRKTNSLSENDNQQKSESVDYKNPDDFEPRIRTQPKPRGQKNIPKKFIRPRYASTELGIREKLFIAVLSSKDPTGAAQNKTLAHYIKKLVYFIDGEKPKNFDGMSVISLTKGATPLSILKYISDRYPNAYDWILLVTDDTYVRGEKLMNFVSDISVSRHLYVGATGGTSVCPIKQGVLLSQSVLSSVVADSSWCSQNSLSKDPSANLQACIQHATGLQCTDMENSFKTYYKPEFDFDSDVSLQNENHEFDQVLTVGSISDDVDMYKTHKYFCEVELQETRKLLDDTKEQIVDMTKTAPGNMKAQWPIGVEKPFKPKTRFDVLRWEYFTETEIFPDNEFTTVMALEGANKKDIDDIITLTVEKMKAKYNDQYSDHRLVNGYRRLDTSRGMEYILDVAMLDQVTGKEIIRRVQLVRPLSHLEIVPMPYVTENTRLNLVVPVTVNDRDAMATFLDWYARTSLDTGDNTNLLIVLLYPQTDGRNDGADDVFSGLKSSITFYENKYQNGAQITMVSIHKTFPDHFDIMDTVSKQYPLNSLLVLCSVNMELSIDYLNRVRMNTLLKWQVFFPIPFQQYKPNLVYNVRPLPTTIDVLKNQGYFNKESLSHCSFYKSDYLAARSSVSYADDLFELFVRYKKVHVLRAVEPGLKIRYHERHCNPMLSEKLYQRCLTERSEGLASRAQLAKLVFEHEMKVKGTL